MTALALIREAAACGARLSLAGDRVRVEAPPGSLPAELRARLSDAKPALWIVLAQDSQPARLRSLAKLAGCPIGYVDRLHPVEVAEYAHYPDADAVRSLQHLAACRACRERQCGPVTCATCARFLPDALNPDAGMGQCADGFGSDGPPTFPSVTRHCQAWRAEA